MRGSRFILFTVIAIFSALLFAAAVSAETVNGHFEYTYNNSIIVDNDWTFDTETGLLTITKVGTNNWNECGTGQSGFDKYGGWSKYNSQIKKVVLVGSFQKISNNAFKGCTALEEIAITSGISQIDHSAFLGCSSLHTIYIDGYIKTKGMADLRNISVINAGILSGTAITSVFTSSNTDSSIAENAFPAGLTELIGSAGTVFETYAKKNGIKYSLGNHFINIDIMMDGKTYNSVSAAFGIKLEDLGILGNGNAILFFEDKECTRLCDTAQHITEPIILHAKEVLRFDSWSVRVKDHNGLRAVFEYNMIDLANSDMAIVSVGAIAGKSEYALNDFTLDTEGIKTVLVYENGSKVGLTLGAPKNGKVNFAISAVGFEGSEAEFSERAMENIVFRGFVTLQNNKTGKLFTYYTDAIGTTLAFASTNYLESSSSDLLTSEEKDFIGEAVTATAGKGKDARYTKETLMELLTDIYNDNGKLLVGEEINPNDNAGDIVAKYMEATGQAPSIIGMDLACYGAQLMTSTEKYRIEFLKALIDYCRDGGVITASSHFQNPTRNWTSGGLCRGYLGNEDMWEDLITDGTALNREFIRELNVDAAFLRELGNNDVPILWRPFHEMNGNWFWWCIRQENNYLVMERCFHDVWKYVYNYYENELGLTNLIWVYSPNNDTGGLTDVDYCYPGDEYVDMTGLDWYTSGNFEIGSDVGAYFKMMDHGMPTALTEYGSSGVLDSIQTWEDIQKMYEKGMKLTYILTWTASHSFPSCGKADELMAKPDVLSVNEVFDMFKALETK